MIVARVWTWVGFSN